MCNVSELMHASPEKIGLKRPAQIMAGKKILKNFFSVFGKTKTFVKKNCPNSP